MKKKTLIICFNYLNRDPRILRQISWLKDESDLTTLGYSASGAANVKHIEFAPQINKDLSVKFRRAAKYFSRDYESYYWNSEMKELSKRAKVHAYDTIIANDIDTLPLAFAIAGENTEIFFDAHEYAPLEHEESLKFRVLRQPFVEYLCEKYIPKASKAVTVCQGIAELYEQNYKKKFGVITNAAEFREVKPSAVDPEKIRLIYHGGANRSRRLENKIEMMNFLDERYELNFMLLGDEKYIEDLKQKAAPNKNIKFLPPVPFTEIIDFTNQFDIGVYSLAPTNTNNRLALPNKLFEFVQARLAIAIAPSTEMKRIVETHDLGAVAEDFQAKSLADAVKRMSPDKIRHYKDQADKSAFDLSAEKNKEIFLRIFKS